MVQRSTAPGNPPVFFVGLDLPSWVQTLMGAMPGSQAMRLLVDGLTGQAMYGGWMLAFGVLALWAVLNVCSATK